jgi:hypothetical protein
MFSKALIVETMSHSPLAPFFAIVPWGWSPVATCDKYRNQIHGHQGVATYRQLGFIIKLTEQLQSKDFTRNEDISDYG